MLGENIKNLRKEKKITMKTLATELGLSESTISLYEKGKRMPDYDTLKKICAYFKVPIDYMLDEGIFAKQDLVEKYLDIILKTMSKHGWSLLCSLIETLPSFRSKLVFLYPVLKDIKLEDSCNSIHLFFFIDPRVTKDKNKFGNNELELLKEMVNLIDEKASASDVNIINQGILKEVIDALEQDHLNKYRLLDSKGKAKVDDYINDLIESKLYAAPNEITHDEMLSTRELINNRFTEETSRMHNIIDIQSNIDKDYNFTNKKEKWSY